MAWLLRLSRALDAELAAAEVMLVERFRVWVIGRR